MLRDKAYLIDILVAARLAREYLKGQTEDEFYQNIEKQDSVIRRLEIIGEAARRISDETQASLPEMPWDDMRRMRNFLIHEYDDVDISIVWDTAQNHLPTIIALLEKELQ